MGYARILKDNTGKPSGYRECDGEVAFMPEQQSYENIFRRIKIDVDTMDFRETILIYAPLILEVSIGGSDIARIVAEVSSQISIPES